MSSTTRFAGHWHVRNATLPNGQSAYTGTIDIIRTGSAYDLDWDISDGRYAGIGLTAGSHLAVSCAAASRAGRCASDADRLTAHWALGGYGTLGTEVLHRIQKA
jgi:hypothetical protein